MPWPILYSKSLYEKRVKTFWTYSNCNFFFRDDDRAEKHQKHRALLKVILLFFFILEGVLFCLLLNPILQGTLLWFCPLLKKSNGNSYLFVADAPTEKKKHKNLVLPPVGGPLFWAVKSPMEERVNRFMHVKDFVYSDKFSWCRGQKFSWTAKINRQTVR